MPINIADPFGSYGTFSTPGGTTANVFTLKNVSTQYNGSSYIAQEVDNADGSVYSPPATTIAASDPGYNEYQAWLKADSWNTSQRKVIDDAAAAKKAGTGVNSNTNITPPTPSTDPNVINPKATIFPGGGGGGGGGGFPLPDFSAPASTDNAPPPTWWETNHKKVYIGIAILVVVLVIWHRKAIFKDAKKITK